VKGFIKGGGNVLNNWTFVSFLSNAALNAVTNVQKIGSQALKSFTEPRSSSVRLYWNFRAIAQEVSRRLPKAASCVRAQVRLFGICGGQSGTGADFCSSTPVSPANSHSTSCFILIITYHPGLVQHTKWCSTYKMDSVPPHPKKLPNTVKL
jgi:hypothetical protein